MGFWEKTKELAGDALEATGGALKMAGGAIGDGARVVGNGIETASRTVLGDKITDGIGNRINGVTDFINKPAIPGIPGYTRGGLMLDVGLTALSFATAGLATPLLAARVATKAKLISKGVRGGVQLYDKFQDSRKAAKALRVASGATRGVGDDLAQAGARVATNSADDVARVAARTESRAKLVQGVEKGEKLAAQGLGAASAYNMTSGSIEAYDTVTGTIEDVVEAKEKVSGLLELREMFNEIANDPSSNPLMKLIAGFIAPILDKFITDRVKGFGESIRNGTAFAASGKNGPFSGTIEAVLGNNNNNQPALGQPVQTNKPAFSLS